MGFGLRRACRCRRDSSGFHYSRASRHSNHFPTKALKIELSAHREMRTNLGDQGSQVRVLSPRFAAHCSAVQPFPLSFRRFQLAGISHFAGTSTHSLVDFLSCKTTLIRAGRPDRAG